MRARWLQHTPPAPADPKVQKEVVDLTQDSDDLRERVEEFKHHQPGDTELDDQVASDEEANGDDTVEVHMLEEVELEFVEDAIHLKRVHLQAEVIPPDGVIEAWN